MLIHCFGSHQASKLTAPDCCTCCYALIGASLHFLDSSHSVGGCAQHCSQDAHLEHAAVWLAGMHHTGDVSVPIPYMAPQ